MRKEEYIARERPREAVEVVQHIRVAVEQLRDQPRMGRKGRVQGTQELVIHRNPYIVPYCVFHAIPATDSRVSLPPFPVESCH